MEKTAVEFLISELHIRLLKINSEPDGIVRETMINNFLIDTDQAKEMEKQQRKETFEHSRLAKIFEKDMPPVWESFEQYYNEIFKHK